MVTQNPQPGRKPEEPPRRVPPPEDDTEYYPAVRAKPQYSKGGGGDSGGLMKTIVVTAMISAIVVFLMSTMGLVGVTKADFSSNLANVAADIASLKETQALVPPIQSGLSSLQTNVQTLTSQMQSSNTNVANAINKATEVSSSLTNMNGKISTMATQSDTTALKALIDAQAKLITSLQTDVAALKTTNTPSNNSSNGATGVTVKLKSMSEFLLPNFPGDTTNTDNCTLAGNIRLLLTNTTTQDVEDIVLDILIGTEEAIITRKSATLTSSGTTWHRVSWDSSTMEFGNSQWGLNLAAGETKTLYLTLTVKGDGTINFNTRYENGVGFFVDSVNVQ